jgi:phage shock protein C
MSGKRAVFRLSEKERKTVMAKKLYRSRTNRVIWGICGGLGEYFDIDPTIIRVIAIVSIFFGTAGIWIYIIMRLIVPEEQRVAR